MEKTFGFIGCGSMGGALVRAVSRAVSPSLIRINNRTAAKAEKLAAETKVTVSDAETIAATCDYIFLGVKPNGMEALLSSMKETLLKRKNPAVLVSMAAGIPTEKLRLWSDGAPVIRIMPNLPVSVGAGMTLCCSAGTTDEENAGFSDAMQYSGKLLWLDESKIDAGCAVSGCGPAYAFLFLEAMADGGVKCGLSRADAQLLAAQTLLGSAELLLKAGGHPGEWKDAVCSPGGSTIEGVLALEEGAFRSDTAKAVIAAYNKTKKLS